MQVILAAVMAAIFSYLINTFAFRKYGDRAITYFSPVVEETVKTLLAYSFGAGIFITHVLFGMIEGVSDMRRLRPFMGLVSATASIISHAVFGYITVILFDATGWLAAGAGGAWAVHMLWNVFVVYYVEKRGV